VEALGRGSRGIEKCLYQENAVRMCKVEVVEAVEAFFYNKRRITM
jgi:hypothetical protein